MFVRLRASHTPAAQAVGAFPRATRWDRLVACLGLIGDPGTGVRDRTRLSA